MEWSRSKWWLLELLGALYLREYSLYRSHLLDILSTTDSLLEVLRFSEFSPLWGVLTDLIHEGEKRGE